MSSTRSILSRPSRVVRFWLATSRGSALASRARSQISLSAFSLAISSSSWSRVSSNLSLHFWMSSHLFSRRVLLSCWFHLNRLAIITLAISKCYGKVRVLFFPRDNSLISRGNSHVSRVRGLVVRCLLFNPEVSCSNPWVCANFFTSIPKQKVLTFFGTMRLFGFVRLFFGFVRLFFEIF